MKAMGALKVARRPMHGGVPGQLLLQNRRGRRLHNKDVFIGCVFCRYARPLGAPQSPQRALLVHAARRTNTPLVRLALRKNGSQPEFEKYGRNRRPKASCLHALNCDRPRPCWPAVATWWLIFFAPVWPSAASVLKLGFRSRAASPSRPASLPKDKSHETYPSPLHARHGCRLGGLRGKLQTLNPRSDAPGFKGAGSNLSAPRW